MSSSSSPITATGTLSFTGLSSYSNDFQSILSREVAIAKLPLQALQNQQSDLLQKKALLVSLNTAVGDVGTSLAALATAAQGQGLLANSSDTTKVTVQNTGSVSPGTYSISNISSVASAASERSTAGYADGTSAAVSSAGNVNLVVGSKTYNISLAAGKNNLGGLRDAINGLNAGVTATVLTTGTGATPDYLVVSANSTGQQTLQVNDVASDGTQTNLITSSNQGTNASFNLNGIPVTRSSNVVNDVIPGITFAIQGTTSGAPVTISTSTDRTQLASALQDFASKYNSLVSQVNGQVGTGAGLLGGDFIIRQVETDLNHVTSYQATGSGDIKGLANLGLTVDTTGNLTFDQNAFNSLSDSQLSQAFQFIGTPTTGLGALAQSFNQLSDQNSGLIRLQEDSYDQTNQNLTNQINNTNTQISSLTASVTARLQLADAAISTLQQQQSIITASIQAVDLTLYGKNFGIAGATA